MTVLCSTVMTAYNGITNQPIMFAEYVTADHVNWITFRGTAPSNVEATLTAWMRVSSHGRHRAAILVLRRLVQAVHGLRVADHAQDDGSVAPPSSVLVSVLVLVLVSSAEHFAEPILSARAVMERPARCRTFRARG
jgi:hypothetical protein